MSLHRLREDRNCLNCSSTVEERYCPHCGQENTINRKPFYYLFAFFIGNIFAYDNAVWKTVKILLFKPGKIIKDYIEGKRKSYVSPVRLYFFVSFFTFFIPFALPEFDPQENKTTEEINLSEKMLNDSLNISTAEGKVDSVLPTDSTLTETNSDTDSLTDDIKNNLNSETVTISTSQDKPFLSLPPGKADENWFLKKIRQKNNDIEARKNLKGEEIKEKFIEALINNLPKAIFLYLPFFSIILWVFYKKKKWYFYDHGVFTLYFFSFLLLLFVLNYLLNWILTLTEYYAPALSDYLNLISSLVVAGSFLYSLIYFYKSLKKVYEEGRWKTRVKCISIVFTNNIFFIIFFSFFFVYIFLIV